MFRSKFRRLVFIAVVFSTILVTLLAAGVVYAAAPTVTVQAATLIDVTFATGNGNITNLNADGNATERGFEWDIDSGAPYAQTQHTDGSYGTGAFTQIITGLPANTTIYYRAWATNPGGTSYSGELNFHTAVTDAYWVGASGSWSQAATHWAESTGGAPNAEHLPATQTNVHFDAASGFAVGDKTVTIGATAYCADMDWTGAPNNPIFTGAQNFLMYGSLTLSAGMTFGGTGELKFAGGGSETITTNGVSVDFTGGAQNGVTFDDTGSMGTIWTLQDAFSTTGGLCLEEGELRTNGQIVTASGGFYGLEVDLALAKTLTLGASVLNLTNGLRFCDDVDHTAFTFSGASSTINVSGTGSDFYVATDMSLTFGTVNLTGAGTQLITGNNTFTNLNRTSTVVKTDNLSLANNQTITGTLTLNGNFATNRLLIQSDTPGTYRTLTAAVVSASNVDFLDIQGAGVASWNLSAISGGSGDAGHNAGITFTTPVSRYWRTNTGSWSDITQWAAAPTGGVGASIPLVQDTAYFDASSITIDSRVITMDMPRIGKIDMTDVARVPQFDGDGSGGGVVNLWNNIILGDVNFTPTTTNFYGRGTQAVWSNGEQFDSAVNLYNYGAVWHIEDDFVATGTVRLSAGTLNMQGLQLTCNSFVSTTTTYDRSIAWQGGEFYLTYANPSWNVAATNLTIGTNTGDIIFNPVSGNATFTSGGFTTYNQITIQGSTSYTTTVSGAFTCNILKLDRSLAAKTLTGNITITLNTGLSIPVAGTTVVTITNTDFAKVGGGTVASTYLSISGSTASGVGATFLAGVAPPSTNGAGNSGWSFVDPTVPTIATGTATGMTTTSATLVGSVSAMGSFTPLYGFFQYGITATYDGSWVTSAEIAAPITAMGSYSLAVVGLSGDVDYNVRFVVRYNILDYTYAAYGAFNTSGSPVVVTLAATDTTETTASLQGNLTSLGIYSSAVVSFEYGLTTSYGSTATVATPTMITTGAFSANLTKLVAGTTYHYRALAAYGGAGSPSVGTDATFTATGGNTIIRIQKAGVFFTYDDDGDWLITAEIFNEYPPYYPKEDISTLFVLQLRGTDDTTVIAASPLENWGDRPASIYLNPTLAGTLTENSAYHVVVVGLFAGAPTSATQPAMDYELTAGDWHGADLNFLDEWCKGAAYSMGVTDSSELGYKVYYLTSLSEPKRTIINDAGGGYFMTGIPKIEQIRPDLFSIVSKKPSFTQGSSANTWDDPDQTTGVLWKSYLGTNIGDAVDKMAIPFGVTGRNFLVGIIFLGMLLCVIWVAMNGAGALGAVLLYVPMLWLGAQFKIVPVGILMVLTIIFGFFWIRQFIIKTT